MTVAELIVAALLVISGLAALSAGVGLWTMPDFFLRMHAPGVVYSLGTWSVTLASVVHFTTGATELSLHVWVVIVLLSIAAPVTTVLLARAALFRGRQAGDDLPGPLAETADPQKRTG